LCGQQIREVFLAAQRYATMRSSRLMVAIGHMPYICAERRRMRVCGRALREGMCAVNVPLDRLKNSI
jgi:hypothetical protein